MTPTAADPRYIINTPNGYFVLWVSPDTLAQLDPNKKHATELSSDEADEVAKKLKRLGVICAKIEVET